MKKKSAPTKNRSDWLYASIKEPTQTITITHKCDGTIEILEAEKDSHRLVRSYERDSGKDKVLSAFPGEKISLDRDFDKNLLSNYDFLLSADTATIEVNNTTISACTAYAINKNIRNARGELRYQHLASYAIINPSPTIKPELIGWHLVINKNISKSEHLSSKIGLIVDSELGKIPDINKRKEFYFNDQLLPTNIQLIYASDASTDSITNQMIRMCDSVSVSIAHYVAARIEQVRLKIKKESFCEGWVEVAPKSQT